MEIWVTRNYSTVRKIYKIFQSIDEMFDWIQNNFSIIILIFILSLISFRIKLKIWITQIFHENEKNMTKLPQRKYIRLHSKYIWCWGHSFVWNKMDLHFVDYSKMGLLHLTNCLKQRKGINKEPWLIYYEHKTTIKKWRGLKNCNFSFRRLNIRWLTSSLNIFIRIV